MSRPFCVSPDEYVVVRMRVDGVRLGNKHLPRHGRYGFVHCVRPDMALELVRERLANCAMTRAQIEALAARQAAANLDNSSKRETSYQQEGAPS
jgi:hypothetical protein